jgi:hypothetical protein
MVSVAGAVPQKPFRVCQLGGCNRPVTRRRRKYCSRHSNLNVLNHVQTLYDRPEVRALAEEQDKVERIVEPMRQGLEGVWHAEEITEQSRRVEEQIWQAISALPRPWPLSKIEREARVAWEEFPESNSEPLDFFIRERLGLIAKKGAAPSDVLRQRVWELLDDCFKPVPGYVQGEWFLLGWQERQKLTSLVREKLRRYLILLRVLSKGSGEVDIDLEKELPAAVMLIWDEMRRGGRLSRRDRKPLTFRSAVSEYLAEHAAIEGGSVSDVPLEPEVHRSDSSHGAEEEFLAEFEAREEARQTTDLIRRWVEEAGLSPREHAVYEFDLRIGTDFATKPEATKAAAQAFGVELGTVRTYRKRYHDKLRKVAGV